MVLFDYKVFCFFFSTFSNYRVGTRSGTLESRNRIRNKAFRIHNTVQTNPLLGVCSLVFATEVHFLKKSFQKLKIFIFIIKIFTHKTLKQRFPFQFGRIRAVRAQNPFPPYIYPHTYREMYTQSREKKSPPPHPHHYLRRGGRGGGGEGGKKKSFNQFSALSPTTTKTYCRQVRLEPTAGLRSCC